LKRQGYKGYCSIEYETGSVPELESNLPKCITFFDETTTETGEVGRYPVSCLGLGSEHSPKFEFVGKPLSVENRLKSPLLPIWEKGVGG